MSKHMQTWNKLKYEKYIKEGRGMGEGSDYIPWIKIYDFSSKGTISRVLGWKSHRVHHLMSNNELMYFYQLEWNDNVNDIREQFPLSDLSKTVEIARGMGVKHPTDSQSGYPYVLTTDFLITTDSGVYARTVKTVKELQNDRVIEKLEIERRYWTEMGVDWRIVTEKNISVQKARNIEWVHNSLTLPKIEGDAQKTLSALEEIVFMFETTPNSVYSICTDVDNFYGFEAGMGLRLFKFLVANKKIYIDMEERINIMYPRDNCFSEVMAI